MANVFWISAGSNLGDRAANIDRAFAMLAAEPGVSVEAVSRKVETEPVDVPPEYRDLKFLNAAARVSSGFEPHRLLDLCLRIEAALGRVRPAPRNSPRPVDLDMVCGMRVDGSWIEVCDFPRLVLPHPRAHLRAFVIEPLREIDPAAAGRLLERTPAGKAR